MRKTPIIVLIIWLFASWAYAQTQAIVRLNPETLIKTETVSLGDVGEIRGDNKTVTRLKKILLGYSPKIGSIREISKERIRMAIAATGFSGKEVLLEAPKSIHLRRAGQKIKPSDIREAVESAVLKQLIDNGVDARIVYIKLPEDIETPVGKVDINVNTSAVRNLFARFSLPIEIRVNKRVYRLYSANVELEAFAEVYVTARDLPRNIRIKESDVTLEKRRITKPLSSYLRKKEKLRGTKTVRDINKGSELTTDSYVPDVVIKTGDLVRIEGTSGRLKIAVNGEARASGRIGDRISVKNLQSNRILQAVVYDEGIVKVLF